jgi:nucleotide-binding universal stress UspA family protein
MFKKILVTLDGSDLSERALQPAISMAQAFGAELILLRVLATDPVAVAAGRAPHNYELRILVEQRDRSEAEAYLHGIKSQWRNSGLIMHARVCGGAPPEVILSVAEETAVDLIVMSTHGRTGLSRLLYGSVAEAVLRGTTMPVLLVPVK